MQRTGVILAVAAVFASGCGGEGRAPASEQLQQSRQALLQYNGIELNGIEFNGIEFNGIEFNGIEFNGSELNGTELNGSVLGGGTTGTLSELWLEGSELVGRTGEGLQVRGAALTGAELGSAGSPWRYRIEGIEADGDVWHYSVSFGIGTGWAPLCGDGVRAIPLAGRWNYGQGVPGGGDHIDASGVFTFACENAALGKCVNFGYAPWRELTSGGTLAAHHQACTRMVRADYCGDGTSFTLNGTPINIYDGVGIQADTETMAFEAEWTAEGAACLSGRRRESTGVPACAASLAIPDCGDTAHFDAGTLLMTEYVSQ
jgi:hypothetical protein